MSTREFKFSDSMNTPIDPRYFTKLPEGMEPQAWMRLKTILAFYMPPDPKMGVYPMLFDDKYWNIHLQPVQSGGKNRQFYMLTYNYRNKHDEEGISAALMFRQIVVKDAVLNRAYEILNAKYHMYDCEYSQNLNIRITPNKV